MAILIERHLYEIVPTTTHPHVTVYCEDGELLIRQGEDSIMVGSAAAKLIAEAIGHLTEAK